MAQALEVLIIAGPNGAGKTTFALEFLPQEAQARVHQRVLQGGHNIPADVIERRFEAGYWNFENLYKPMVDAWAVYDNSGMKPVLLSWGEK